MAELTVSQLIKLIIGILVVVAVVTGAYMVFRGGVFDFLNTVETKPVTLIRSLFRG